MPMEMFVSCVGDLVTLEGSVGRDLGPAIPLVHYLFFSPPLLFLVLFVHKALGSGKFYSTSFLHCDRVEFLRHGDRNRTREGSGHCLDNHSAGA